MNGPDLYSNSDKELQLFLPDNHKRFLGDQQIINRLSNGLLDHAACYHVIIVYSDQ